MPSGLCSVPVKGGSGGSTGAIITEQMMGTTRCHPAQLCPVSKPAATLSAQNQALPKSPQLVSEQGLPQGFLTSQCLQLRQNDPVFAV